MLQELLQLLPPDAGDTGKWIGLLTAIIGVFFWLAGARFSRQMITLAMVALGAWVGKKIPGWFEWNFSPAAPATALAVLGGVAGYALHRFWVGVMLGFAVAFWGVLGLWILFHGQTSWSWPTPSADTTVENSTVLDFARQVWDSLNDDVRAPAPYLAGGAVLVGIITSLIVPRLATVLNWSLLGTSMIGLGGIAAMQYGRPEWLGKLPADNWAQISSFGAALAFGAIVQWKIAPPGRVKLVKVQKTEDEEKMA